MKRVSEKPQHIGLDNKPSGERNQIDLNLELIGDPTGRNPRFFAKNHHGVGSESDKKKSERRYRNMLEMLLAEDARYAKLYYEVQDTLNRARQAVDQALTDIHQHLEEAEKTLRIMQDSAARLDDGTMVFRSTVDGHVYTEDGRKLSDDEAQDIEFPENAPNREGYNTQWTKVETAKQQIAEVETYQREVLDPAQERMNDENDPPSLEELKKIERDVQTQKPEVLSQFFYQEGITANKSSSDNVSAAQDISGKSPLNMPPMNAQFERARLDLPDIETLPQLENTQIIIPAV